MAGQPRKRALAEALEQRTRDAFDGEENVDQFTHLDYVEFWQASGNTLGQLAKELSVEPDFITRYLYRTYGQETVKERLRDARGRGAHSLSDKAFAIAMDAKTDNHNVAKLQVSTLQWTAEKWNQQEFGKQQQATNVYNIGELHIGALRAMTRGSTTALDTLNGAVVSSGAANPPARLIEGGELVGTAIVTGRE